MSYALLWDTLKAVLRGHIISAEAFKNKTNKNKLAELEHQIGIFKKKNMLNQSRYLYQKILLLKYEYTRL